MSRIKIVRDGRWWRPVVKRWYGWDDPLCAGLNMYEFYEEAIEALESRGYEVPEEIKTKYKGKPKLVD